MRHRAFGPAASSVPVLGIGTWQMERDDRAGAIGAIRRALDLGMLHVDTAEMYGDGKVETLVGEALSGRREQVFLVSKVLPQHAAYASTIAACEASLRRLGTDVLDLYLLHWRGSVPLEETVRAFETLKAQGKIRRWGVSNFDDEDLAELAALTPPANITCNQVLYHLAQREIEHRVIPWCAQHGVAVVAYSPFGSRGGFARSRELDAIAKRCAATPRQVALAFLTRHANVFAIPKSSNVAHVEEIAGADRVALDDAALAAIDAAFPLAPWRGLPTL